MKQTEYENDTITYDEVHPGMKRHSVVKLTLSQCWTADRAWRFKGILCAQLSPH